MPRTNQDGKDIRLVVSWLCGRFVSDAEMADAVGIPTTNYSRRKDSDEFPSFEELQKVAEQFNLCALSLQVAFGYLDTAVVVLDDDGLRQYIEQGGGEAPSTFHRKESMNSTNVASARRRRDDAPPGP